MGRRPNGASSIYQDKDGGWHGRVTVGTRDDGRPDRRHVRGKTEAEVTTKVRRLERERDSGTVRKPGQRWTVAAWLTHWVENIAGPAVRDKHTRRVSRSGEQAPHSWRGCAPARQAGARAPGEALQPDDGQGQRARDGIPGPPNDPDRARRGGSPGYRSRTGGFARAKHSD